MYAVVKTGGKQYRVSPGDTLRVELLDVKEGDEVTLDQILMIGEGESVTIGSPLIDNASVTAKVVKHGRDKKVRIVKFRRRKHHHKQMGHRQGFTELEITGLSGAGLSATAPAKSNHTQESNPVEASPAPSSPPAQSTARRSETGALKFLDAPDGDKDDLKQISGVGPVLEDTLNELGIYHFHQIAAFTQADIDAVEAETNFPGRITRDEWIKQAEDLAKG